MTGDDPLAQPITIGNRQLRNRMVMTPHLGRLGPGRLPPYLERRAEAGVAMAVMPAGMGVMGFPVYPQEIVAELDGSRGDQDGVTYHPRDERHQSRLLAGVHDFLAGLADTVQRHGTVAIGQIHHPGAEQSWDTFQPAIAPSAVRGDEFGTVPHELTADDIGHLIHAYAQTSAGIIAAGFDGVELHSSHGYLLNRFASPYYNRRTDEWRAGDAFLRRLLETIRERVGTGPLLGVRLQVWEELPGGLDPEKAARIAVGIAPYIDYLSVSIGNHNGLRDSRPTTAYTSPWLVDPAPAADGARRIRAAMAEAGVPRPLLVTGRITTPRRARAILADGVADMVGLARALISDPDFVAKSLAGQDDRIDECIGCNECVRVPFSCAVNPAAGREAQRNGRTPGKSRGIVVVGAGPAGVHAAAGAAERGHRVVLLDRADEIGGTLRHLVRSPMLAEWSALLTQLRRRVRDSGVDFRPGTVADGESVAQFEPDVVIWATGSTPAPAGFPTDTPVLSTMDLLGGARPTSGVPVVVVGGAEPHLEPFIAADLLAEEGWPVVLLTERSAFGVDVEPRTLNAMLARLVRLGVELRPMSRPTGWTAGTLRTEHTFGGDPGAIGAGAVVLAHGRVASGIPAQPAAAHVIGDALAPRRITHAVLEGSRFGSVL